MIVLSTAAKNHVLSGGSLRTAFMNGGTGEFLIAIYAGTVPTTADDATGSATLKCVIRENNTSGTPPYDYAQGLTFEANAINGALVKTASMVWSGTSLAVSGVPTFFRMFRYGEDPTTSNTAFFRLQGTCAQYGADLNLGIDISPATPVLVTIGAFELRAV